MAGESPAQLGGPLSGLAPGSRVAGYLLERLIGVGGMAAVYQARDERLGRVVALKVLAGDEALRRRFVREARSVAAVDHRLMPASNLGNSRRDSGARRAAITLAVRSAHDRTWSDPAPALAPVK